MKKLHENTEHSQKQTQKFTMKNNNKRIVSKKRAEMDAQK